MADPRSAVQTEPEARSAGLGLVRSDRLRRGLNWVNLSTPLGWAVAAAGGCRLRRGPGLLWLAEGYRYRFPAAMAFTVGDVVISRDDLDRLTARHPRLLDHEAVHARQWALCLGLPFLPLYLTATAWSYLRTGDRAARNAFERSAGLHSGGYRDVPVRPLSSLVRRTAVPPAGVPR